MLSAALNLKLLSPREVINAAIAEHDAGRAPLAAVEGFVRQILGWREFIRGVYWMDMPRLREANHFHHTRPLPHWYWTAKTHMACMQAAIGQTLAHGYIQRMSNYCSGCRYDPKQKTGPGACPLTTLYWNFLDRHEKKFAAEPRTALMVKNLQRLSAEERTAIREWAGKTLSILDSL